MSMNKLSILDGLIYLSISMYYIWLLYTEQSCSTDLLLRALNYNLFLESRCLKTIFLTFFSFLE